MVEELTEQEQQVFTTIIELSDQHQNPSKLQLLSETADELDMSYLQVMKAFKGAVEKAVEGMFESQSSVNQTRKN